MGCRASAAETNEGCAGTRMSRLAVAGISQSSSSICVSSDVQDDTGVPASVPLRECEVVESRARSRTPRPPPGRRARTASRRAGPRAPSLGARCALPRPRRVGATSSSSAKARSASTNTPASSGSWSSTSTSPRCSAKRYVVGVAADQAVPVGDVPDRPRRGVSVVAGNAHRSSPDAGGGNARQHGGYEEREAEDHGPPAAFRQTASGHSPWLAREARAPRGTRFACARGVRSAAGARVPVHPDS